MSGAIANAWASYRERVMHPDSSVLQVQECRRSFYAGAATLLDSILGGLDGGSEPTDADMERMDQIHSELKQFLQDVVADRA